jgi:hypothetical protein
MASQSHDSDEEMSVTPPGSTKESKSLSRNAQAQARLRARRKAYVDSVSCPVLIISVNYRLIGRFSFLFSWKQMSKGYKQLSMLLL